MVKVKLSLFLIKYHPNEINTYEGVEVLLHSFFTSALDGAKWPATRLSRCTLGERDPGTHLIGDWVGLRYGPDAMAKKKSILLLGIELR
jgi:hypothetical protein